MKKLIICILLVTCPLVFASGEISFRKQRDKEEKYENARIKSLENSNRVEEDKNLTTEEELELEENKKKKKRLIFLN